MYIVYYNLFYALVTVLPIESNSNPGKHHCCENRKQKWTTGEEESSPDVRDGEVVRRNASRLHGREQPLRQTIRLEATVIKSSETRWL